MESLDREIAAAFTEPPVGRSPGRILIVATDDAKRRRMIEELERRGHACVRVRRLADARKKLASNRFDLLVIETPLPDGDGLELASSAQLAAPPTRTLILFHGADFTRAVAALRCGVADLVDVSASPSEVADRIEAAMVTTRADRQREERLARLEEVCRKLMAAREEVSEQLDQLCRELASAYQDVAEQLDEAAMAAEFRTLLRQELDLEELLRTALEYLLSKTGPTNAAVFLPDAQGEFDLGAYVNYDCPRETITLLLNHLCRSVCPQMAEEPEIVSFEDADAFAEYVGAEAGFLAGSQVLAFACRYDGRCMAVMVLFRSRQEPFEEPLATTIEILRGIFAEQVTSVVKVHHRASPQWPKEAMGDEECDLNNDGDQDDLGFGGLLA